MTLATQARSPAEAAVQAHTRTASPPNGLWSVQENGEREYGGPAECDHQGASRDDRPASHRSRASCRRYLVARSVADCVHVRVVCCYCGTQKVLEEQPPARTCDPSTATIVAKQLRNCIRVMAPPLSVRETGLGSGPPRGVSRSQVRSARTSSRMGLPGDGHLVTRAASGGHRDGGIIQFNVGLLEYSCLASSGMAEREQKASIIWWRMLRASQEWPSPVRRKEPVHVLNEFSLGNDPPLGD